MSQTGFALRTRLLCEGGEGSFQVCSCCRQVHHRGPHRLKACCVLLCCDALLDTRCLRVKFCYFCHF